MDPKIREKSLQPNSKSEGCATRKRYRASGRDTAVKVYTINQESRYVLVEDVPALGVERELLQLMALYGPIDEYRRLDQHPTADAFNDVYWLQYRQLSDAQNAKRRTDDTVLVGKRLRVSYAPQFESIDDTRHKLAERRRIVRSRRSRLPPHHPPAAAAALPASPATVCSSSSHPAAAGVTAAAGYCTAAGHKRARPADAPGTDGQPAAMRWPRDADGQHSAWTAVAGNSSMARSLCSIRSRLAGQLPSPSSPPPAATVAAVPHQFGSVQHGVPADAADPQQHHGHHHHRHHQHGQPHVTAAPSRPASSTLATAAAQMSSSTSVRRRI
eukprot:TRINITY_DN2518_c0_g2_i1.p1 TRINITY_DN2518_c0_g2~~TRINITY_DN2518_c0_g2_i1.p1  ORF type:complete len:328 (+),score=100.05 TRINITY_DN2518_c0_g2_i1:154-1137(+)